MVYLIFFHPKSYPKISYLKCAVDHQKASCLRYRKTLKSRTNNKADVSLLSAEHDNYREIYESG